MNLHRQASWRAVAPLSLSLCVLAGLAPTLLHKSDNFNNNSLANFWGDGATGNSKVHETNGRLELSSTGPTGVFSGAGIGFNPYGINWKKDFHIEFTYRLKINSMASPKQLFLGATMAVAGNVPTSFTGVAAGLLRDSGGLWVGILQYNNGGIVDFDGFPVTQITGRIEIDWDKSMDRMTVQRSGGGSAHIDGYYAANGATYGNMPMEIGLGAITYNGNITFTGPNCYIDNFEADFYKRNFTP